MADQDQNIAYKELELLSLDPHNPRLPENLDTSKEGNIINYIATTTSIEDLMSAIAENNFFPGEPLVVIPSGEKFIVVEGNRRLTAVILLNNPNSCARPTARMKEISDNAKYRPTSLPVVVKETREEVLPYLGFRHITGVKQWEPLAKARYMLQLFELTSKDSPEDKYSEVARSIGSRRDHIKRNLTALAVYRTIEKHDFFGISELDEETIKFAVLSTAIADERIGKFIGTVTASEEDTHPIIDPSQLHINQIQELTEWLFKKNEKGETRVGESRNLRELSLVVDNEEALKVFRDGSSLSYAFRLTKGATEDLLQLLYSAEESLTRAAGFVANADFNKEALDVARNILENIRLIGKTIRDKEQQVDEF